MTHPSLRALIAGAALSALALSGCSSSEPVEAADPAGDTGAGGTEYPLTIENCGREVVITKKPTRVSAQPSNQVETLAFLGLSDRVVGWWGIAEPTPHPELDAAYEALPEASASALSKEALVGSGTELLLSNFAFEGASIEDLDSIGIPMLQPTVYCSTEGAVGTRAGSAVSTDEDGKPRIVDALFDDVATLGRVFDASEEAEGLISAQRERLDAVATSVEGKPAPRVAAVFFMSGFDGPVRVEGKLGIPQAMVDIAGGDNVFSDLDQSFVDVSAETLVDAAPEHLIIIETGPNNLDAIRTMMRESDVYRSIPAVQQDRFTAISMEEYWPGLRFADAVERIAADIHR